MGTVMPTVMLQALLPFQPSKSVGFYVIFPIVFHPGEGLHDGMGGFTWGQLHPWRGLRMEGRIHISTCSHLLAQPGLVGRDSGPLSVHDMVSASNCFHLPDGLWGAQRLTDLN